MSVSFGCNFRPTPTTIPSAATCPERKKRPVNRAWEVWYRYGNRSAFNGYRDTPSDWSSVYCKICGAHGRTKAAYVSALPDRSDDA